MLAYQAERRTRTPGVPGQSLGPGQSVAAATDASIMGRVLTSNGRPIAGARIDATHVAIGSQRMAITQADGQYEIFAVPAGLVRVTPTIASSVQATVLAEALGQNVTLSEGEQREGLDFVVPRGSVVTGSVIDERGEPIEGATIHLWRVRTRAGRTLAERAGDVLARRTDDRGHLRLYGILPGSYFISATEELPTPDAFVSAPIVRRAFYPDASVSAAAAPLHVGAGQDLSGANIVFRHSHLTRVHGRIVDSAGRPFRGSVVLAVSRRSGALIGDSRNIETGDGTFVFHGVAPGDYVLKATADAEPGFFMRQPGDDPREAGSTFVTVAGDEVPVSLQTGSGSSLRGRVVVEGAAPGAPVPDVTVTAVAADDDLAPANPRRMAPVGADGTFELENLVGPVRIALNGTPPGWWVKSVNVDGVNAAVDPVVFGRELQSRVGVEVLLSRTGAEISGSVRPNAGVTAGAVLLLFPTAARRWYPQSPFLRLAAADEDGRFSFSGLPPEEYLLVAVDAAQVNPLSDEWQNVDLLARLAGSSRQVRLAEGEHVEVQLAVERIR